MDTRKKKILIIDDQPEVLTLVEVTFHGTEFQIVQALDAKEGVLQAKRQQPSLILLDIMMPGFDGYRTAKALRRNPDTKEIPIIFLTAKKERKDIQAAILAGGVDYIAKPFSPAELLTRIRHVIESTNIKRVNGRTRKEKNSYTEEDTVENDIQRESVIEIIRHDKIAVLSTVLDAIVLKNVRIFRDAFAGLISDGIFYIVFDFTGINKIDGSGLGLLISANESLKKYDGELKVTYPSKAVNSRFTYLKINDLFRTYNNVQSAIECFSSDEEVDKQENESAKVNVCLTCTFVNAPKFRYCGFCGTNLVLGDGDKILTILRELLTHRILSDTNSESIDEINKERGIKAEEYEIPKEFLVEIYDDDSMIVYRSNKTDTTFFEKYQQISIQAPKIGQSIITLISGLNVRLANPHIGGYSKYNTKILHIDHQKGMMDVQYTEEATILHSRKNFTVAPKLPIAVQFVIPSLRNCQDIYEAKILELSRQRISVFSETPIPLYQCMGITFILPSGELISSPFVIATRGKHNFMYDIEFMIIDENESSRITQYMYKRQIELVKAVPY